MKYSQVFIVDKRPTLGPGARAALKIGAAVGFDSGFPPVRSILATLVAGWIYSGYIRRGMLRRWSLGGVCVALRKI
jgi:hypothetical protein